MICLSTASQKNKVGHGFLEQKQKHKAKQGPRFTAGGHMHIWIVGSTAEADLSITALHRQCSGVFECVKRAQREMFTAAHILSVDLPYLYDVFRNIVR